MKKTEKTAQPQSRRAEGEIHAVNPSGGFTQRQKDLECNEKRRVVDSKKGPKTRVGMVKGVGATEKGVFGSLVWGGVARGAKARRVKRKMNGGEKNASGGASKPDQAHQNTLGGGKGWKELLKSA